MTEEPTRRRRGSLLPLFVGLFLVLFVGYGVIVALIAAVGAGGRIGSTLAKDRIGVIDVSGLITAQSTMGMFGGVSGAGADRIVGHIRSAAADHTIRAVVVRIDSPGGTPAASQEIFSAILAARERKPFVASMADVAASGAYYVAAACDRIVANRATLTGSIGVMMPGYDLSGLLEWVRVKPTVITSGKFKDIGSFDRPMRAEERELLQAMVDNTYEQFLTDVAIGRKVPPAKIRPHADGRIFTGEQAKKVGLVDELGGFYDAVRVAEKAAGMAPSTEPNLYYYGRGTLLEQLLAVTPTSRGSGPPAAALPPLLAPLWLLGPFGAQLPRL